MTKEQRVEVDALVSPIMYELGEKDFESEQNKIEIGFFAKSTNVLFHISIGYIPDSSTGIRDKFSLVFYLECRKTCANATIIIPFDEEKDRYKSTRNIEYANNKAIEDIKKWLPDVKEWLTDEFKKAAKVTHSSDES